MTSRINSSGTMNGFFGLIGTLVLLAAIVLPVSAFQLNGQSVSATAPGETVSYPVILDEAPDGLAGYILTVQFGNPAIGEITEVTYPAWASLNKSGTLPADSVSLKAADLADSVPDGSTSITLATLTFRADHAGTTPVTITVTQMDDDNWDLMTPAVQAGSFTVAGTPATGDSKVGVYRSSSQKFILKNGTATTEIIFGKSTDTPVTGDWNGDGAMDVGVHRSSLKKFLLKNDSGNTVVKWGLATDTPVAGDWNGDDMGDVGVFRPSLQKFVLKNGTVKTIVKWGQTTDIPVSGDWNGDGLGDVGVFRPSARQFILKNGTEKTMIPFGESTDIPVAGDWNEDGLWDIGVFRPSTQQFLLKNGAETSTITFGLGTDIPIAGKWI